MVSSVSPLRCDITEVYDARVAISIGAGLYEELLFRMTLFYAIGTLFHSLIGTSRGAATTIAIVLIALSLYLPPSQVGLIALVVAAWYAFEVYRSHRTVAPHTTTAAIEAKPEARVYTSTTTREASKVN